MTTPSEVARAASRATRLYPRSKQFRDVYVAGARARVAGRPADACPYPRDPTGSWRRSFRRVWMSGYESAAGEDE